MKKWSLVLLVVFIAACGGSKDSNSQVSDTRNAEPIKPTDTQTTESQTPAPETTPAPIPAPAPAPAPLPQPDLVLNPADVKAIDSLLPTMYYTAMEKDIPCTGKYGRSGPIYKGSEKSKIVDKAGNLIETVCTRFFRVLNMEGSAILKDRGQGEVAVNYSGVVGGVRRFHKLGKCIYGEGIKPDLCLLPYHTLATDNKVHKIGDIIYMPKAEGLHLPDGSVHEGFFIVRDTGGAFVGIGAKRVDMFTGTDPDHDNVFLKAGFHHKEPTEAYKIEGPSADIIRERLQAKFGNLY